MILHLGAVLRLCEADATFTLRYMSEHNMIHILHPMNEPEY